MYQIKVNDKHSFNISVDTNELKVNDEIIVIDHQFLDANKSHVLYKNKSYTIELVELNKEDKIAVIKVNGNSHYLTIEDQFDQLLKKLGMDNLATNKILQIKAPMPGLVLSVLVAEGTEVKKGENLLVLEAMKMENMIKSPTDGIIKKMEIKQGDKVEKNQILINFNA